MNGAANNATAQSATTQSGRTQRGAALIIALALMVILSLLASSGMRQSIAELLMAGNEQFRQAAAIAASAGIEAAIAQIARRGAGPTSSETLARTLEDDAYAVTVRYAGDETNLPGSSVGKFVGLHYEIVSSGTSSRFARDEQVQGVMVVSAAAGSVSTFRQRGAGLDTEVAP